MSEVRLVVEADRTRCVLCGEPNECLLARGDVQPGERCWCVAETFPAALTERATATDLLLDALAIEQKVGGLSPRLLSALHRLGVTSRAVGESDRAGEVFRRAMDASAAVYGEHDFATLVFQEEYKLLLSKQ